MARSGQKNFAPLCAEPISGSAKSEVIKLIRHRLHEPLGPTLLVLQLLLREEALSPQGALLFGCSSGASRKKSAPSENC
jgi:hypothetical protein